MYCCVGIYTWNCRITSGKCFCRLVPFGLHPPPPVEASKGETLCTIVLLWVSCVVFVFLTLTQNLLPKAVCEWVPFDPFAIPTHPHQLKQAKVRLSSSLECCEGVELFLYFWIYLPLPPSFHLIPLLSLHCLWKGQEISKSMVPILFYHSRDQVSHDR